MCSSLLLFNVLLNDVKRVALKRIKEAEIEWEFVCTSDNRNLIIFANSDINKK